MIIITWNRLPRQGGGVTSHPSHPLDPPLLWTDVECDGGLWLQMSTPPMSVIRSELTVSPARRALRDLLSRGRTTTTMQRQSHVWVSTRQFSRRLNSTPTHSSLRRLERRREKRRALMSQSSTNFSFRRIVPVHCRFSSYTARHHDDALSTPLHPPSRPSPFFLLLPFSSPSLSPIPLPLLFSPSHAVFPPAPFPFSILFSPVAPSRLYTIRTGG